MRRTVLLFVSVVLAMVVLASGGALAKVTIGTDADDIITGTKHADRIAAGDGDDVVRGGAGNDHIYGEDGMDLLQGGKGNDRIFSGDFSKTR